MKDIGWKLGVKIFACVMAACVGTGLIINFGAGLLNEKSDLAVYSGLAIVLAASVVMYVLIWRFLVKTMDEEKARIEEERLAKEQAEKGDVS
jgi:hypothetical protein